jgi:multicomponent Na+:H+ antiporter subunit D
MLTGVLGAMSQTHLRRILAFLLISQMGAMLLGLSLATENGLAASFIFMIHDALVLTALLSIGGNVELLFRTGDIQRMGGLARHEPLLALLWFLASLSLAGIPPLGGFFARLMLLQVTLEQQAYLAAGLVSFVYLCSLLPLLKIWHTVFWKKLPDGLPKPRRATVNQVFPGVLLIGSLLLFTLTMTDVVDYSYSLVDQALDRDGYIEDVLNPTVDREP